MSGTVLRFSYRLRSAGVAVLRTRSGGGVDDRAPVDHAHRRDVEVAAARIADVRLGVGVERDLQLAAGVGEGLGAARPRQLRARTEYAVLGRFGARAGRPGADRVRGRIRSATASRPLNRAERRRHPRTRARVLRRPAARTRGRHRATGAARPSRHARRRSVPATTVHRRRPLPSTADTPGRRGRRTGSDRSRHHLRRESGPKSRPRTGRPVISTPRA